jgi:hypothetical protein
LQQLARLALPFGIGEQAPLIPMGVDAISISAGGELPVPAADAEALSPGTLTRFARAALDVELALDSAGGVEHGPDSYIEVAGTIVPGWAIRLLALALILPALVAAVDATARAGRQGQGLPALRWTAPRGLPILAALAFVYALAWIGIIARPDFPFEPRAIGIGPTEVLKILAVVGVAVAVWRALGSNAIPDGLDREAIASAAGLLTAAAVLVIWVFNPFLGLLIVPLAHAWVPSAQHARRPLRTAAAIILASLPFLLAAASVTARLHLGSSLPWQAVVAVGDWGVSPLVALPGALLAGWLASLVVAARP